MSVPAAQPTHVVQRDLRLAEQLDHGGDIKSIRAGRVEPPEQHSRRHGWLALTRCNEPAAAASSRPSTPRSTTAASSIRPCASLSSASVPDANACGAAKTPRDIAIASVRSASAAPQSPFSNRTRP